jgi:hypothetical protein
MSRCRSSAGLSAQRSCLVQVLNRTWRQNTQRTCKANIASARKRKSVRPLLAICEAERHSEHVGGQVYGGGACDGSALTSRTSRWKGSRRMSRSVLFWYLRISRSATVPRRTRRLGLTGGTAAVFRADFVVVRRPPRIGPVPASCEREQRRGSKCLTCWACCCIVLAVMCCTAELYMAYQRFVLDLAAPRRLLSHLLGRGFPQLDNLLGLARLQAGGATEGQVCEEPSPTIWQPSVLRLQLAAGPATAP